MKSWLVNGDLYSANAYCYIIGGLDWWFGYLGLLYKRDCYLEASPESQTTGPQKIHQFSMS